MQSGDRIAAGLRRRDVLRLGALAPLWGVACRTAHTIAPAAGPEAPVPVALSAHHLAVLTALVDALHPGDGGRPAALAIGVPQRIDEELYFAPERFREQIGLALDLLEYGGLVAGFRGRFSRLDRERRARVVLGLLDHRIGLARRVAAGLAQIANGFYYADERTWEGIGYDGPWVPRSPPASEAHYRARLDEVRDAEDR